jgi:hypothetical protein
MAKRPRKRPADAAAQIADMLGGKAAPAKKADQELRKHFTADEHIAWIEANCFREDKGKWKPATYRRWQVQATRKLLALDERGQLVHKTLMPCYVRRCGKSEWSAHYELHRCMAYEDQVIVIQGNSEDQGEDTVLKAVVDTIRNSPSLAALEKSGKIEIAAGQVCFHETGSVIKVQPAKESTTYGQKISVYHNTEGCKASSDALYQVGASSTGDPWCGVSIIDSNMGDAANFVHDFVQKAQAAEAEAAEAAEAGRPVDLSVGDPSIACVWIWFADLDDVIKRGCGVGLDDPDEAIHPWLDAAWIRSRWAQMTRSEFLRNHCNQPSGAGEVLWTDEQIDPLFSANLPTIISRGAKIAHNNWEIDTSAMAVGVGLDRAGAFSKTPDRTVLAAVGRVIVPALIGSLPVYDERGEEIGKETCDGSVYILIGAWKFMRQLADPLKERILAIQRRWRISAMRLEAYQASDLAEWCETIPALKRPITEIRHMTSQAKQQLVTSVHGLIVTRRFVAPSAYNILREEIKNYREDASGGGIPSYGGKRKTMELSILLPDGKPLVRDGKPATYKTWIKDDYLEAVLWAIEAARDGKLIKKARTVAKPAGW